MTEVYLFDWGNTLMVDFPGVPGKMCNWEKVEAVEGAEDALNFLSQQAKLYVATGAAESSEMEINAAFKRVGLDKYISGYFCKANLGIGKGSSAFYSAILTKLDKHPHQVTMVGDSVKNDIEPALALGINTVLLSKNKMHHLSDKVSIISSLRELCSLKE